MAAGLTTVAASLNGAVRSIIAGADGGANLAPAHVLVDQFGVPLGVAGNELAVRNRTVVPAACTGNLTLANANQPQSAQQAQASPVTIILYNPDNAVDQGIGAAEPIWINAVGPAAAASGGSSIKLNPGASIVIGPIVGAVSWVAASAGHKIEGYTLT
jgi:hypothetical protein